MELLEQLKSLNKEDLEIRLKNLTDEEKKELENLEAVSIEWHRYSWYNLYFILTLRGFGTYGTFQQLKKHWRMVKKWSKWVPILTPIFNDKDKKEIRFFKTTYVFHIDDTNLLDNKEIWENV